jgi:hypothetical protein
MTTTTMAPIIVPPEKATHIENIFEGLVALGAQLAMSSDGIRDGIALRRVYRKDTMEFQEYCLAAGVLVGEAGSQRWWSRAGSRDSSARTPKRLPSPSR